MSNIRLTTVVILALGAMGCAHAAYSVTTFSPAQWGASDTVLGLAPGATIEDFEDLSLAANLQVSATAAGGSYGPTATLPAVFDPTLDANPLKAFYSYPCGNASCSSLWDGSHSLVNTYTNQAMNYNSSANWGDLALDFATGVTQVGFSLQQNERAVSVFINGASTPAFNIAAVAGGGRAGYVRIDVTGASAPITSVRLSNNATGDGWAIDHVAFATAVPEPATWLLWSAGVLALLSRRRRRD
jgi:hypothetical protein